MSGPNINVILREGSQMIIDRRQFLKKAATVTGGALLPLGPISRLWAAPSRVYLGQGPDFRAWTYNGQIYPNADLLRVRAGERVRLRYGNHSMMAHPMHLHGHFFRLVNPSLPHERWALKDTLVIDHMQRFDVEFIADNPGKWFHHCHNLYHMEAGMANVVVYDDSTRRMDL